MEEIDNQLDQIIRSAWAESTLKTRNSQWKRYIDFCVSNELDYLPGDVITIARFLVYLGNTCKYTTCNNYLSAVITLHKFFGFTPHFRESFVLQLVLKGLGRRLGKAVDQKIGLNPSQLISIFDVLDLSDVNVITKWAALILSFRTLLRKSNIVQNSYKELGSVVQRSDIEFSATGVLLHVRKSKTIQASERVLHIPVNYVNCRGLCAARMLGTHLARTSHIVDGPLFYMFRKDGTYKPLLYGELLTFLKDMVSKIGLSPSQVGLHSMRRAGASFLQSIGVSLVDIMNAGDWQSLAALSYLVSPLERKQHIESVVCQSLNSHSN